MPVISTLGCAGCGSKLRSLSLSIGNPTFVDCAGDTKDARYLAFERTKDARASSENGLCAEAPPVSRASTLGAPADQPEPAGLLARPARRRLQGEILLVLGLSLGASALYAVVNFVDLLSRAAPIAQQSVALNGALSDRSLFDLTYRLLGIFFDLVPVALVLFLLTLPGRSGFARVGLDRRRPRFDLGSGLLLAAGIGIPGLGLYLAGRAVGVTPAISSTLDSYWWTIPVLILTALRAGLQEEVIVVGYLFTRLDELGWGRWRIILSSALLRGTYHLYQGVGAFVGNAIMGVVFGWFYTRYGRTTPLVIAHTLLNTVTFVGFPVAVSLLPALFGPTR